jgi:hypothetical protein
VTLRAEKGQVPTRADEYRRKAAQCLELAQRVEEASSKAVLLEMAQSWLELADRVHREESRPADE